MSTLNADFLSGMGMDEKVVKETEAQEIHEGFTPIESGAYKAEIKELATFKTASGATMMKIVTHLIKEDKEIIEYTNTVKRDGTPNKIGQEAFAHLLDAICGEDKSALSVKKEQIKAYAKEAEGSVVKGIAGKPFIAMVRSIHTTGSKYEFSNEVEPYANTAGQNIKGEDLVEAFKKKILDKPVLERTEKAQAGGSSATTGTTTATSESIADQL